jgi:acyl carrier protein
MEKTYDLENRVKDCIIDRLDLQMAPEQINNDEPLFSSGLGLDSLDSLEVVIALGKQFNVHVKDEDFGVLTSINTICDFIRSQTDSN